jgi:AcrR family transcriptional regulator
MGIRERHDRERQAVQEAILDAARDLFTSHGYNNVSIRKIAERIEYSPAAIYRYFPSKDEIFFALAEEGFHRLDAHIQAIPVADDPLVDVRQTWWGFYEFSKRQPEFFNLMFVDRSVPRLTEQWAGLVVVHELLAHASARIQRCIDAGVFPATLDAGVAMHVLWAALVGPGVIGAGCRLAPGEDPDLLAGDVLATTLAGLRAGVSHAFIPCAPDDRPLVGTSMPNGVPSHDA